MKANNYIKQLKEIVNNNVLESIECVNYVVQVYGISANEYEVITKFAKINGRYYFIDRDGNKYLASRYDRAGLDMFGIDGGARFPCALFLLLFAGVEIAVNVEINIIAVFDRLFPPLFNNQKPVSFVVPFISWYRIIKDMRK